MKQALGTWWEYSGKEELVKIHISKRGENYSIDTKDLYNEDMYEWEERIPVLVSKQRVDDILHLPSEGIQGRVNEIAEEILWLQSSFERKVLVLLPYKERKAIAA